MRIVLAEDHEESRSVLEIALRAWGHVVTSFANGEDALSHARRNPPELIISDILMPKMDGFDFCRAVRRDERLRQTPFVFYTATYVDEQDRQFALSLGATRFVVKPVEITEMQEIIEDLIRQHERGELEVMPGADADDELFDRMHGDALARKLEKKILDLERANLALIETEGRFRQLAENISEGFWISNQDGSEILYQSPAHKDLVTQGGELARWGEHIHPEDRLRVESVFFRRAQEGRAEVEYRVVRPDGATRWIRDRGFPVANEHGQVYRIAGLAEDITEARELTQKLAYQATFDSLTGLVNRRAFEQRLRRVLDSAVQKGTEHALCYMDLDQFKVINDTCGHAAGDELLRQIGLSLSKVVRNRDTLARLGGDEFGLLMEHCSLEQAMRVAETLKKTVEGFRFSWERQSFTVGVSIGLVPLNESSGNINSVLGAADSACYAAKDRGRNRIHLYRPDDLELARRHGEMRWVSRLNAALEENRLRLFCQAIRTVGGADTGEPPHRYELLVRLEDETGELVLPSRFLPAAERYNLSTRIDRWVVAEAFKWIDECRDRIELCFINLSGRSLGDEEFLEFCYHTLAADESLPSKVCFEVTETAAIANLSEANRFIERLRELGCKFALDDFGSGLSSFAYLKTLPVDFLKIDGLFVRGIVEDPIDFAMVKSINEIGHVLGKKTIAEFVESEAIWGRLSEIGVDFAQGFHIERPKPIEEVAVRLP